MWTSPTSVSDPPPPAAAAPAISSPPPPPPPPSPALCPSNVGELLSLSVLLSTRRHLRTRGPQAASSAASSSHSRYQVTVVSRSARLRSGLDDGSPFVLSTHQFYERDDRFATTDALLTALAGNAGSVAEEEEEDDYFDGEEDPRAAPRNRRGASVYLSCVENPAGSGAERSDPVRAALRALSSLVDARLHRGEDDPSSRVVLPLGKPLDADDAAEAYADRKLRTLLARPTERNRSDHYMTYKGATFDDAGAVHRATGLLLREDGDLAGLFSEEGSHGFHAGSIGSHLQMDRTAAAAINLFPAAGAGGNVYGSVFGVLDRTVTKKMGRRVLGRWLRQPSVDVTEIDARLDVVQYFLEHPTGRAVADALRGGAALRALPDLEALAGRFVSTNGKRRAGLKHLYEAYVVASQGLPGVVAALEDPANPADPAWSPLDPRVESLREAAAHLSGLADLVTTVLDMDAAPRELRVRASFDEDLEELSHTLAEADAAIQAAHADVDARWADFRGSSGRVKLEADGETGGSMAASGGYQFRLVDANHEKALRMNFDADRCLEVKVLRILKNGVYFSTRALREAAAARSEAGKEYERCSKKIVEQATEVVETYVPVLEGVAAACGELDVLAGFAEAASAADCRGGYCRPTLTDGDGEGYGIDILQARHPCVELQDGVDYIPNDYRLLNDKSSFLLVTGPNMGGKSTYIRALGSLVAMAQVGSFLPAASATINIVDRILCRVGAGDLQQQGISTFMAEMLESSSMLHAATPRSLIIIDELGRGTSTFDGYGIAWAISEYIVRKLGCPTLFATHFHELTALEQQEKCVRNVHVSAHVDSSELTFLYNVEEGPCLESFGIQVAEMARVPKCVIADAKRKAAELENFSYKKRSQEGSPTGEDSTVPTV